MATENITPGDSSFYIVAAFFLNEKHASLFLEQVAWNIINCKVLLSSKSLEKDVCKQSTLAYPPECVSI